MARSGKRARPDASGDQRAPNEGARNEGAPGRGSTDQGSPDGPLREAPDLFGDGDAPAKKPPDHRHGHRERLRARFMAGGGTAVADYELLELVLFRAIPRRDVKPVAKRLIERFGGVAAAIGAPADALREIDGLGDSAVTELKIVAEAARVLARAEADHREILSDHEAVVRYCRIAMAHDEIEQFRVLFLDNRNRLIGDEQLGRGTVNEVQVYPREIARRALALNATAVLLTHNHPSGDPTPSKSDVRITLRVRESLQAVGVTLHDHIVIGRSGDASLSALKLI